MRQQRGSAAGGHLAPSQELVELGAFDALLTLTGFGFVQHLAQPHHVLKAVDHPCLGRRAIAAGTAGFLVVRLDALGQVGMGDETHIRLVDAHAESDGGDHHHAVVAQEARLVGGADVVRQTGVIGQGIVARFAQCLGGGLHLAPGEAIDNAGFAAMLVEKCRKLLPGAGLRLHGVADVGAVETVDERGGLLERQPSDDLCPGALVCGGCEGHARDAGERLGQNVEAQVVLAKVVPPLRHAVGLVDGDEGDLDRAQELQRFRLQQPFRGEIDEVQLASASALRECPDAPSDRGWS